MKVFTITSADDMYDVITDLIRNDADLIESVDAEIDLFHEPITVAGIKFNASTILKQCDPIAYDIYTDDYIDGMVKDCINELNEYGETEYNNVFKITLETVSK